MALVVIHILTYQYKWIMANEKLNVSFISNFKLFPKKTSSIFKYSINEILH